MEFNDDLLRQDIAAVRDFVVRFLKSFGPSQKKVAGEPISFFEEMYIRFRLHLVDMGPVKWFKTSVVIIGGIIIYFVLFRRGDDLFRLVSVLLFIFFYVWVWGGELEKEAEDGKAGLDRYLVSIQKGITGAFSKPEEKKK